MSNKPSYLGLLNAIANGESQAHCYLTAWIETTDDPDVKCVLSTVAAREGEHGMSFAKRINELGYSVIEKKDEGFEKRMAIASSKRSDLEKMEKLGFGRLDTGDKPDFFDNIFKDHSIDIATGELLGRYIAEERDSGRLLSGCYQQLCAREGKPAGAQASIGDDRLASLETKVDAICAAIEDLRATVVKSKTSNGNGARRRVKT
jgi:rubrerythrin